MKWVVFTDLDESLLDRETYSFEAARPALEELRSRGVPVVFCTSKTAPETLYFQERAGIEGPFVVEGGGGVYVPRGYFERLPAGAEERGSSFLLPLAARHEEVLRGLGRLKEYSANSIRAFDDMTVEEVANETGLPAELARRAKEREFDEPFKFVRREGEFAPHLPRVAAEVGLRVTKGGRYYHLHGETDKGRAVQLLASLFKKKLGPVRTIGVGDSEMDLPLLAAVDVPLAVLRHDGRHDAALSAGVRRLRKIPERGPAGWNLGVLEALRG